MKQSVRLLLAGCAAFLVAGSAVGTPRTAAQDPQGEPASEIGIQAEQLFAGIPAYSIFRTQDTALTLSSPVYANAFTPQPTPCPSSAGVNGCTIRVTVSSQLSIAPGGFAVANVLIGGATVEPAPIVALGEGNSPVRTMQWIARNLPAGSTPTITVQFRAASSSGSAGFRTLSIDVLTGLL